MKKIILVLVLITMGANAQITVKECEQLSKKINDNAYIDQMSENMQKFSSNDCDRRMGEPTREKRVNEIREAFRKYGN